MNTAAELALFRFLREMGGYMESVREPDRLLRYALRETQRHFRADEACLASIEPGLDLPEIRFSLPGQTHWPREMLAMILRGERTSSPHNYVLAPVRRRGRNWGVLTLRRSQGNFDTTAGKALTRVTSMLNRFLDQIDRGRVLEVRSRIDRKVMERLRPRDLFYQILHSLRSLTGYDHSSSFFVADESPFLELVAEQIAWRKGRSRRIGRKLPLSEALRETISGEQVYGFTRRDEVWRPWPGAALPGLPELFDTENEPDGSESGPCCNELLCAPLATRDGLIGVLTVSALHAGTFGEFEREVLAHFTSQASVAVQYMQRTESLQLRMLEAEKKHAVANLARGVSHDVNNALGVVLPLVQQLIEDTRGGATQPEMLLTDLQKIEEAVQLCRRIFGGMLAFARGTARRVGQGNIRRAIESTLGILRDGMLRQGIELQVDVADDLPLIRAGQGDLEQLFLNLASNARDAMPKGGLLNVSARPHGLMVEVMLRDTGVGIPAEHLERIQEPFFTTKQAGNGLGLSICRSLIWEMRGSLEVRSEVDVGTHVRLLLPAAEPASGEAAP